MSSLPPGKQRVAKEKGRRYVVGYKRPPRGTQFKPGQSGNPKGRPKGAKNLASALKAELETRVVVTESGRQKTITKGEALVKRLVHKALEGDSKAITLLFGEERANDRRSATAEALPVFDTAADAAVMESIIARIRTFQAPPTGGGHTVEPGAEADGECPLPASADQNNENDVID